MIKINASYRLRVTAAEDGPIAPAESFKEKNEKQVEKQQDEVGKAADKGTETKVGSRVQARFTKV